MKKKEPTSALNYVNEKSPLAKIIQQLRLIEQLNQRVLNQLEESMRPYCRVGNLINNRLVMVVANSAIATRIRLQSANLLDRFKQDEILKKIHYIHCKVGIAPTQRTKKTLSAPKIELSDEAASAIEEIANTIDHPQLQNAMLRIAAHKKGK